MKIKDLPRIERPREKLQKYGPERLSDAELLAILLRTGRQGISAVELARKILAHKNNKTIADAGVDELRRVPGLGLAKSCEIIACFELGRRLLQGKKSTLLLSPEEVWQELKDIRNQKKEHFIIFFLDARNQEIAREVISVGTLTMSVVHPREVFETAIARSAAQILLAHNHPSGDPEPSGEDIRVTAQLIEAGKILGIQILDHVIVSGTGFRSMKACGLLPS
ncbi:MAG: DNA repair protein RadC [Candidatus Sungiibacteriota bacterium]